MTATAAATVEALTLGGAVAVGVSGGATGVGIGAAGAGSGNKIRTDVLAAIQGGARLTGKSHGVNVGLTISNASSYLLPRLLGPRALPIVLDGRRISGIEAHSLGLLDYFVESPEEVVSEALRVIRRWNDRGLASRFLLELLRPPLAEIEDAIAHENAIGKKAWDAGTGREGIARFVREQEAKREARGS